MPLARQFLSANIKEMLPNVWEVRIEFSYYSLYVFTETHIENTVDKAIRWLLIQRCGADRLRVVNTQGLNVNLL